MGVERFSTDDAPFHRRIDCWQHAVTGSFGHRAVIVSGADSSFHGRLVTRPLGQVTLTLLEHRAVGAYQITRGLRHVRQQDRADFLLELHLDGGMIEFRQDGREALIGRAGDFSLLDDALPSMRYCPPSSSVRSVAASIPRGLLIEKVPRLGELTAVTVDGQTSAGRHLATLMADLAPHLEEDWFSGASAARLSHALVDLLSVALLEARGPHDATRDSGTAPLVDSVYRFVEQHLADQRLSPRVIADAHHISLRQLHRLFEDEDVTPAEWIRSRRLEEVSRQLADPASAHVPVSSVGARWGYADPSAFSRAFRARYGVPPRDYRAAILGGSASGATGQVLGAR